MTTMRIRLPHLILLSAALVLLAAASARAQAVDTVEFTVMRNATPPVAASAAYTLPLSGFNCTLPATTTVPSNVVNPRTYRFTNPNDSATDCEMVEPIGGPLTVLPFDQTTTYYVTGRFRNVNGFGPAASSVNSFRRPGAAPTASPANLRVGPSQ